jgi:F-type H+-transporting ATPase subunit b
MVIVLVVFIGLMVYLNKTLYQPLINFMDQRDATIAKDLEEVSKLSSDSASLEAEAQEILNKAKQEALEIRQKAIEEANAEAEKLIEAKKAELETMQKEFMEKLEKEKEELKAGILSQLPLIKETLKAKFSQL